jgi:hypothetical protein
MDRAALMPVRKAWMSWPRRIGKPTRLGYFLSWSFLVVADVKRRSSTVPREPTAILSIGPHAAIAMFTAEPERTD